MFKEISSTQWRVLLAAHLGWLLDGFDIMLFAFSLTSIKHDFFLSSGQAGLLASATLLSSSLGGILAGFAADRLGRARVLIYSILCYSLFTGLTATSTSLTALFIWRLLVGFGLGGEWSAGSVLVAESWPPEHRGKASGLMQAGWALGYILAAIAAGLIIPHWGWRTLFVIGVFPALLTSWIRKQIPESPIWEKVHRKNKMDLSPLWKDVEIRNRVVVSTCLSSVLLFAYWGLFTWVPTYLSTPVEKGGAGLTLFSSIAWIIPLQLGALLGYVSFGFLSDRWGRKSVFLVYVLASAALTPLYGMCGRTPWLLMILGPLVGFFGHGYFSLFGALLSELFPSSIRGTAQGMCYNLGRAVSSGAPFVIGALSDRYGVGASLSFTAGFYLLAAILIQLLPETKGDTLV